MRVRRDDAELAAVPHLSATKGAEESVIDHEVAGFRFLILKRPRRHYGGQRRLLGDRRKGEYGADKHCRRECGT